MALIFISLTRSELEHLCTSVGHLDFLFYPLVTSLTHLPPELFVFLPYLWAGTSWCSMIVTLYLSDLMETLFSL